MTDTTPTAERDRPERGQAEGGTGPEQRVLGYRGALLALALGGFGIGLTEFMVMGLLPEIRDAFGLTEAVSGNAITFYALGVVVGAPVIASLTARVPRKVLLLGLMVAFTVGNALTVLSPSFAVLCLSRFVAGLPHGAYFGVASLVAAHIAPPGQRAKAVATMMLGLPAANVVGVPTVVALGQVIGWRTAFILVAAVGVITLVSLLRRLPDLSGIPVTDPRTELGALKRRQVWLTLGVAVVGFGGMFAFYSYIAFSVTQVTGLAPGWVPVIQCIYGVGMVAGTYLGGWLADRVPERGMIGILLVLAGVLVLFPAAAHSVYTLIPACLAVAATGSALVPGLQTRLMDVAENAQTLAASLNHAALNAANALGAWLGGHVISLGYGPTAPAVVGSVLALAGAVVMVTAVVLRRRSEAIVTEISEI